MNNFKLKIDDSIDAFLDAITNQIGITKEQAVVFVIACWCLLCVGFIIGFKHGEHDLNESLTKKQASYSLDYFQYKEDNHAHH